MSLILIMKNLICLTDGFELDVCLFTLMLWDLVWVMLECRLRYVRYLSLNVPLREPTLWYAFLISVLVAVL